MKSFFPRIQDRNLLIKILRFSKNKKIKLYLVGGILRDVLLNRDKENLDFDFCLKKGAIGFGRKLARELASGFVVLDREHGACRLVKRVKKNFYTLDFSDFRGKNIEEDLLHRDFTINAMAIELEKIFYAESPYDLFIDPFGAKHDLKTKTVRAVNKKAFDEDPLRILRAFSLSAIFGFKIDKETLELIKLKTNKLSKISYERIRDELFKILDRPNASDYLVAMDKLKILKIIIPEIEIMRGVEQGPYHHLDVWEHTLETIRQLEHLIQELKNNKEVQGYLNEIISGERKHVTLLKLGALFHDIGKPRALRYENGKTMFHGHERVGLEIAENIVKRLRLSNDEFDSLSKMILWHLRPGYLADSEEITPRAKFRYFRDTAKEAVSILLISIADQRATKGPLTSKESRIHHEKVALGLIREYFRKKKEKKLLRLVTGHDLINKFNLEPSPLFGRLLSDIEELQAIGKIKTKKEAFQEVKKLIAKNKLQK